MKKKILPRHLTEKALLDNMVSASDRNFISLVGGEEFLCRYLARSEKKSLGYKICPRNSAAVILYEYAGKEPFSRAYALIESSNDLHPNADLLHS